MPQRRSPRNRLRELLKTRSLVLGSFITMSDNVVIDLASLAGYDFIMLDAEHGGMGLETIANHIRVARGHNLGTLIRVPAHDSNYIMRVLDLGVEGIEIPHVKSVDEARWAVSAVRFPPEGTRGMFTKGVVSDYGLHRYPSLNDLVSAVNAEVVCNIIIEDVDGVDNIDEILAVEGIDFVTVGTGDLAGSLNVIGQPDHPALLEAADKVFAACRKAGIPSHVTGAFVPVISASRSAEDLRARGIWMVSSDTDAVALLHGMQADLAALPERERSLTDLREEGSTGG